MVTHHPCGIMMIFSNLLVQMQGVLIFGSLVAKNGNGNYCRHVLLWFCCREKEEDDNFCHLL
jgi:hypothetical protein